MKRNFPMSKTTFNGIHIDLGDVSLIGKLDRDPSGNWFAPMVWRNTGATINLKMKSPHDRYQVIADNQMEQDEADAKANYERLVAEWKASA